LQITISLILAVIIAAAWVASSFGLMKLAKGKKSIPFMGIMLGGILVKFLIIIILLIVIKNSGICNTAVFGVALFLLVAIATCIEAYLINRKLKRGDFWE
jgi:integral membrane sensor domain MASE1